MGGFTYDISNKHRLGYSEVQLVQKMIDGVNKLWEEDKKYQKQYFGDFPFIASQHSLVAKHVTKEKWDQLKDIKTKTSGFTLAKAIACAVQFNNQHCGIYAGDWDSYKDFAPVFDPIIQEYHGISASARHTSVHIDLPGWTKHSIDKLKARCEELHLQPRGTRGESGGQTGHTYDISNKHRLGYSEVQLVQKMIDGVNTLWKEDQEFQKKYNMSL